MRIWRFTFTIVMLPILQIFHLRFLRNGPILIFWKAVQSKFFWISLLLFFLNACSLRCLRNIDILIFWKAFQFNSFRICVLLYLFHFWLCGNCIMFMRFQFVITLWINNFLIITRGFWYLQGLDIDCHLFLSWFYVWF